jgi:hypothetical protein
MFLNQLGGDSRTVVSRYRDTAWATGRRCGG